MSQRQTQIPLTLFPCPVEGCDMRFRSTSGRTQHILTKHLNFGIDTLSQPQADCGNTSTVRPIDYLLPPQASQSSPQHTVDQLADDDDPDNSMVADPPFSPSPPSALRLPSVHPDDEIFDMNHVESTSHSHTTSSPALDSPPSYADDLVTSKSVDYHPILNGNYIQIPLHTFHSLIICSSTL